MHTFLSFLGHLTPVDWLFIVIAWVIVAFALGTFTGLGIALADRRKPAGEVVNRIPVLPPVPITHPADLDWLSVWPAEDASDDQIHLRFDQIVSAQEWTA